MVKMMMTILTMKMPRSKTIAITSDLMMTRKMMTSSDLYANLSELTIKSEEENRKA